MDVWNMYKFYRRHTLLFYFTLALLAISSLISLYLGTSTRTVERLDDHSETTTSVRTENEHVTFGPVTLADKILKIKFESFNMNLNESIHKAVGLNASFVLNNKNLCNGLLNTSAVLLIYSATRHIRLRNVIRKTWGKRHPSMLRSVFLIGLPIRSEEQKNVIAEFQEYKDMVQGDFLDTYRNSTNKGFVGWRWVMEFCPTARIVVKVDDDVFLNTHKLASFYVPLYAKKDNFVAGYIQKAMPILRDPSWKWDLTENELNREQTFPPYFGGSIVMMARSTMMRLYEKAFSTPYLWIEDVYLYGILVSKLENVEKFSIAKNFTGSKVDLFVECYIDNSYNCDKLATSEVKDPEVMTMLWAMLTQGENERISQLKQKLAVKNDIENQ